MEGAIGGSLTGAMFSEWNYRDGTEPPVFPPDRTRFTDADTLVGGRRLRVDKKVESKD